MFELVIKGFTSKAQVEEFVKWYSGQGEQDAAPWFECRRSEGLIDCDYFLTDIEGTFPLTWNGNQLPMRVVPSS